MPLAFAAAVFQAEEYFEYGEFCAVRADLGKTIEPRYLDRAPCCSLVFPGNQCVVVRTSVRRPGSDQGALGPFT